MQGAEKLGSGNAGRRGPAGSSGMDDATPAGFEGSFMGCFKGIFKGLYKRSVRFRVGFGV